MDTEILNKRIKALLSKTVANGATEAEAASALAAAQALMDRHNISLAVLSMDTPSEIQFIEEVAGEWSRMPSRLHSIQPLIEQIFGVHVTHIESRFQTSKRLAGHKIAIFGEPSQIEPAKWALHFLDQTFQRLWVAYRLTHKAEGKCKIDYYNGLATGFKAKLDDQREEAQAWQNFDAPQLANSARNALAIWKANVDQAFAQSRPNVKLSVQKYNGASDAYEQGVKDGRTINLARPIGQGSRDQLEAR